MNTLASMLTPKSVAIVGASRKPVGPTAMLLENFASYPSSPAITIVNPSGESIRGLPAYRTVPVALDLDNFVSGRAEQPPDIRR